MAKLIAKKYATALFELAASEGLVEKYEQQVKAIYTALQDETDFMAVLKDYKITLEEKVSLTEKVFSENTMYPIVGLLVLLIKKGRQDSLLEVLDTFLDMVKKSSGIVKAVVISTLPLKSEQLQRVKEKLEASTKCQIELETIIDKSIIAGLVIRVGDKVVDASIKGEMQTLKKQLSELRLA